MKIRKYRTFGGKRYRASSTPRSKRQAHQSVLFDRRTRTRGSSRSVKVAPGQYVVYSRD